MKKIIYGLGVAAAITSCGAPNASEELNEVVASNPTVEMNELQEENNNGLKNYRGYPVVFYNVENLFDTKDDPRKDDEDFTPNGYKKWNETRYKDKLTKLSEAISFADSKKNPVLIGLAEVENLKTLRDLSKAGRLKESNYMVVHYESSDKRGIDVGLLYDRDRFKVIEKKKHKVEFSWNRRMTTRDILYVKGELMNGKEMHVFVNHWSSRREGKLETEPKRLEAARVLREQIDLILEENADANILIMGDFNDHPDDKSIMDVLRAKEDDYAKEGDLINLLIEEHQDGEGTINYKREWAVIDQMIVSQGFYKNKNGIGVDKNNAFILREDELVYTYPNGGQKPSATYGGPKYYGGYSDHLPIYLKLK